MPRAMSRRLRPPRWSPSREPALAVRDRRGDPGQRRERTAGRPRLCFANTDQPGHARRHSAWTGHSHGEPPGRPQRLGKPHCGSRVAGYLHRRRDGIRAAAAQAVRVAPSGARPSRTCSTPPEPSPWISARTEIAWCWCCTVREFTAQRPRGRHRQDRRHRPAGAIRGTPAGFRRPRSGQCGAATLPCRPGRNRHHPGCGRQGRDSRNGGPGDRNLDCASGV